MRLGIPDKHACLDESWQSLTLQRLRYKVISDSRRTDWTTKSPLAQAEAVANVREDLADKILARVTLSHEIRAFTPDSS